MSLLMEPFQYPFMQRALAAGVLVGIVCAVLGVFVVLRRMSQIGHALAHSALPGLVLAYIGSFNLFLGALLATVLTGVGIGYLAKDDGVYEDTSIGMIPTVMFAAGIMMMSTTKSFRDLTAMLFGNILGVSALDLAGIALIAAVVIALVVLFYKELVLFCVDGDYAKSIGLPVHALRYGLLILLALTVVVGIQAVGTILTNALLVIPVASARLLTSRLKVMLVLSCVFAVLASISGIYASYYLNVSCGAAIVLACAVIFGVCFGLRNLVLVK